MNDTYLDKINLTFSLTAQNSVGDNVPMTGEHNIERIIMNLAYTLTICQINVSYCVLDLKE